VATSTLRPVCPKKSLRYSLYRRLSGSRSRSGHGGEDSFMLYLTTLHHIRPSTSNGSIYEMERMWKESLLIVYFPTLHSNYIASNDRISESLTGKDVGERGRALILGKKVKLSL
jgi:hypothetical protein